MTGDDTESGLTDDPSLEERRLQAKLDAGTITEDEYARLTALRFGNDPAAFSFADAAAFYGLTEDELREEMAWLSGGGRS
ncbi:hypothetical protein [Salinibaculum salinum]|uniref:hypothetical protein n=1 Tax=Salinibaculum salinum TaxID=3131996 RepID=UPI0030EE161F